MQPPPFLVVTVYVIWQNHAIPNAFTVKYFGNMADKQSSHVRTFAGNAVYHNSDIYCWDTESPS